MQIFDFVGSSCGKEKCTLPVRSACGEVDSAFPVRSACGEVGSVSSVSACGKDMNAFCGKSVGLRRRRGFLVVIVMLLALVTCFSTFARVDASAANIIKGDSAANIRAVQTRLSNLGYYTYKVDGIWGSRTRAAVRNFQRDKGLVVDGIVGAKTERALGITLTSMSTSGGSSASTNDINLLARCVYGEARGEPYTGQVAVAAVVLNRVKSAAFPSTISGVIYQRGAFTAVDDGQINLTPNQSAYNAARDAINGWDPTKGCLYYYNPATATSKWIWSLKVELKIGRHAFARGQ